LKHLKALVIVIIACLLTMTACSGTTTKGGVLLREGIVKRISVTSLPEGYDYSFTGDSAQSIIKYLSELNLLSHFSENPNEYDGMTWVISLEYEGGIIHTIYHFGNMFIKTSGSSWYKMTHEEASRFDELLNELSN
jgi:hypothetical protein